MLDTDIMNNIHEGLYDSQLADIIRAANARQTVVRGSTSIATFGIGDIVEFNNLCGTRYLVGERAQIVGKRRTKVIVKLENPKGRFIRHTADGPISADITVPTSIIDLVDLNK